MINCIVSFLYVHGAGAGNRQSLDIIRRATYEDLSDVLDIGCRYSTLKRETSWTKMLIFSRF